MADYSQPYQPNVLSDAMAANQLQNFFNAQSDRSAMQGAGQMAASGDFPGASSSLLAQGMLPQAKQFSDYASAQSSQAASLAAGKAMAANDDYDIDPASKILLNAGLWDHVTQSRNLIKSLDADKAQALTDTHNQLGDMAKGVSLLPPDQRAPAWASVLNVVRQHGGDTRGYEDPVTGPMYALAVAKKTDEFFNDNMKQRAAELAEHKAQTYYKTEMPGAPGEEPKQALVPFGPGPGGVGVFGRPVVAPEGTDLDKQVGGKTAKANTGIERIADDLQQDWKDRHPGEPEMSRTEALNAAGVINRNNSGTRITFEGGEGGPQVRTSGQEGTSSYTKTEEGAYGIKTSQQHAIADTAVKARNQLLDVVKGHADQLENLSRSPDFNAAMTWLHGPTAGPFIAGKVTNLGNVPAVTNALAMTMKSLAHEYGNFVEAGHKGAASQHEIESLGGIVDQLRQSPDAETLRAGVGTLRDLANEFSKVKLLGPAQRGGGQTQVGQSGQAQPAGGATQFEEGQTATGPGGKRIVFRNGTWVPL
jgi:hypothetical protein